MEGIDSQNNSENWRNIIMYKKFIVGQPAPCSADADKNSKEREMAWKQLISTNTKDMSIPDGDNPISLRLDFILKNPNNGK